MSVRQRAPGDHHRMRCMRWIEYGAGLLLVLMVSGCWLDAYTVPDSRTPAPPALDDVTGVHAGICFEAAFELRERVFVIGSASQHIAFYEWIDAADWCRWPVERRPFEFSEGALLVGLWSYGRGCNARHDVLAVNRDDRTRQIAIQLAFVTDGDCPYELLRPFWVRLPAAQGYTVTLTVE